MTSQTSGSEPRVLVGLDMVIASGSLGGVMAIMLALKYQEGWVRIHHSHDNSVMVCTDLSGKNTHRQVSVGNMVTSRSLGSVMISILAQNARDVGSILTLNGIFLISITLMTICFRQMTTSLKRLHTDGG